MLCLEIAEAFLGANLEAGATFVQYNVEDNDETREVSSLGITVAIAVGCAS